jgi:hypothetical protein
MAHFAQLDENSLVTQVIVVNNSVINNLPFPESEPLGIEFCQSLFGADTIWKQTSYNDNFRKNYAGIGYTYDSVRDAFIPPKPDDPNLNCILDENSCQWICAPNDGNEYVWDPDQDNWVFVGVKTPDVVP